MCSRGGIVVVVLTETAYLMNQWTLALRQIKRNPLRSLLMAVGVTLFAGAIVTVTLLMVGIHQSITRTVARLGADMMLIPRGEQSARQFNEALITGKPTSFYLPRERVRGVAALNGVAQVAAQTYAQTLTNARCCAGHFLLVGFDVSEDFTIRPWLNETVTTWPTVEQDWVIVGDRILLHLGDEVTFYGTTYTVAGVLSPTGTGMDWTVYVPDPVLRRMVTQSQTQAITPLQIEDDQVSALFVRAGPGVDLIDLAETLEQRYPDCQAILSSSVGKLARTQLSLVAYLALSTGGTLWIVAALLSGVVFAQAVRERSAEIALLIAKGATRRFIRGMLVKESLLIALCASLVGSLGAWLIVVSFRQLLALSLGVAEVLPGLTSMVLLVGGGCVFSTLSSVFCSLLPVRAMLRSEPYEAIKRGGNG